MSLTISENKELVRLERQINDTKLWINSLQNEADYYFSEIKSKIERIFKYNRGYSKDFFYHYFITDGLYRAIKYKIPEHTKDFWYRDWSKEPPENWCYDRLNMPGESVWYFSTSMKACIAEIRPQENEIISVANIKQFIFPRRFNYFLHLGSASLGKGDSGLCNMHREAEENRNSRLSELDRKKLKLIDNFMDSIFLHKVTDGERFRCMPSIVITNILKQSHSGRITDGIIYPSVALGQNAVNVALLNPKVDEFNFYLFKTIKFKVAKAERDKLYEVIPLCIGENLYENQYGNFPIFWRKPSQEEFEAYKYSIEINSTLCTS